MVSKKSSAILVVALATIIIVQPVAATKPNSIESRTLKSAPEHPTGPPPVDGIDCDGDGVPEDRLNDYGENCEENQDNSSDSRAAGNNENTDEKTGPQKVTAMISGAVVDTGSTIAETPNCAAGGECTDEVVAAGFTFAACKGACTAAQTGLFLGEQIVEEATGIDDDIG